MSGAPQFVEETKPVEKGKPVEIAKPVVVAVVEAPPPIAETNPPEEPKALDEAKPADKPNTLEMARPPELQIGGGTRPEAAAVPMSSSAPRPPPEAGKTQFMAAPTSFLDIFCDTVEPKEEAAPDAASPPPAAAAKEPAPVNRRRGPRHVAVVRAGLAQQER